VCIDDEEISENALDMLMKYFKETVEIVHKRIILWEEKNKELLLTFSCSLTSLLPHLIAVSERKVFTQSTVNDFFNKHFQTTKKEFISKLVVIL